MYVYQNDKLYVQHETDLFGVEIYPDEVIVLKDEKKKEVKANVATGKAEATNRKSRGK